MMKGCLQQCLEGQKNEVNGCLISKFNFSGRSGKIILSLPAFFQANPVILMFMIDD